MKLRGYANVSGTVVGLIVGIGVAILVLIFVGTLGAQTYQVAEPQIQAINNTEVKNYVTSAVISGFKGLQTTGNYIPLIVLAVIISVVLTLIMQVFPTYGGYYGTAL